MNSDRGAALVIGAQSAIAQALANRLLTQNAVTQVLAVSRTAAPRHADIRHLLCNHEPDQIAQVIDQIRQGQVPLSRVFICTGILHDQGMQPEKSLNSLDPDIMMEVFRINCVIPALWVKALMPILKGDSRCVLTTFSARVGSITDNRKGGWHSYRTSKAALNMFLKTATVEYARMAPGVKLLSFHPGTVDTPMSKPFQKHVPPEALFSPEFVADRLIEITGNLTADGELSYLDWQGKSIPW